MYYSFILPLTRCPTNSGNYSILFYFCACEMFKLCLLAEILSQKFACFQYLALSILIVYLWWIWNQYTTGHTMNSCSNSTNKSNMCCWAFGFQVLETQLMFLHFVTAASFSFQLLQCPSGYKNTDIRDVQYYYRPS